MVPHCSFNRDQTSFSSQVPEAKRRDLLAVVKWYSHGDESEQLEEQKVDEDVIASVINRAIPSVNLNKLGQAMAPYLAMTPTTPDVIRIDIESPEASSPHKPLSTLELIAQRELDGSRIRRSIAKRKSATVAPILEKEPQLDQNPETQEQAVVFTREEVHLLRQVSTPPSHSHFASPHFRSFLSFEKNFYRSQSLISLAKISPLLTRLSSLTLKNI
jgi:hypothetical protein